MAAHTDLSNMDLNEAKEQAADGMGALERARDAYNEFVDLWASAMRTARDLNLHVQRQDDAYMPFVRDQGMGDGPEAWFDKAEAQFQDVLDTED